MRASVGRTWRAIPPSIKLAAIVLAGAALVIQEMRGLSSWIVQTDELQHVRLAISAGQGLDLTPTIHDVPVGGWSQLYPLLIAPAYHLFDMPTAFKVAHVLGALVMASAALPAYLLAREVVSSRAAAYLVAALALATPWSGLSLVLGTEVLAYPLFLWAFLALQRATAAPSPSRDLVAMVAVGAAFLARSQLLILALAFPVAIVVHEVSYALARRPRRPPVAALREGLARAASGHLLIVAAVAGAVLLAAAGLLGDLLGPYRDSVGQSTVFPPGWLSTALKHLSIVGVASGVLPMVLALSWVPLVLAAPGCKRTHAFAVLAVVAGGILFLQASSFVIQFSPPVRSSGPLAADRYFFYLAPLLFVAAAAFFVEGPRHWSAPLLGTLAFATLVPQAGFDLTTLESRSYQASPASAINPQLGEAAMRLGDLLSWGTPSTRGVIAASVLVLGLSVTAGLRYAPARRVGLVVALALLPLGAIQVVHASTALRDQQFPRLPGRDWIDRSPRSGAVGLVPSPVDEGLALTEGREFWWDAEFWNRSVAQSYSYEGATTYTPFFSRPLAVDSVTGRLSGRSLPRFLVLGKDRADLGLQGRIVATNGVLVLVDVGARPWAGWTARGLTRTGRIAPGRTAVVRVFPPQPGGRRRRTDVVVRLAADAKAPAPLRFRVALEGAVARGAVARGAVARGAVARGAVAPGMTAERRFSLCVGSRPATLRVAAARSVAAGGTPSLRLAATRVITTTRACQG